MNVFEYLVEMIKLLFSAAGDNDGIKGALLLLYLLGMLSGLLLSAVVVAIVKKARG